MTLIRLQFLDVSNSEKLFGAWLRQNRKLKGLSMEELGQKVGVSKQYISVLERADDHPLTGKPVTPKKELVVTFAQALKVDENEALKLAGYAPKTSTVPPDIQIIGFDGLDDNDIKEIARFIEFKKSQKT